MRGLAKWRSLGRLVCGHLVVDMEYRMVASEWLMVHVT